MQSILREQLLAGLPATQQRLDLRLAATPVIEGGQGTPLVLLHGQGGSAPMWAPVIPHLVDDWRVVAPDLPGLGESELRGRARLDSRTVLDWLAELIDQTCADPPIVVGHSLGGTIAARFAAAHPDRLRGLVLVDSGSLGRFRPAPRVMLALVRFSARPSVATHERFLRRVLAAPERARATWGERWSAFAGYHIDRAAQPAVGAANRELLRRLGVRSIATDELRRIQAPAALIWGRQDPVMRFRIGERASARFGWPLYPIEECGHVPHIEQPEAFLDALGAAVGAPGARRLATVSER